MALVLTIWSRKYTYTAIDLPVVIAFDTKAYISVVFAQVELPDIARTGGGTTVVFAVEFAVALELFAVMFVVVLFVVFEVMLFVLLLVLLFVELFEGL